MIDFEIQRCARQCAATGRDLKPGEAIFSALVPEGAEVVRRDYAAAAWTGPPDGALGHWKATVPDPHAKRVHWAPSDVMLHYFQELEARPDQADVRYLLALLMIRRKLLRLEATETNAEGREELVVYSAACDTTYRISVLPIAQERIAAIQQQLGDMLFGAASSQ